MLRVLYIAAASLVTVAAAQAQPQPLAAPIVLEIPAAPSGEAVDPGGLTPGRLTDSEMSQISGGQEVLVEVTATQTLTATSSGNSITAQSYVSGDVTFGPEALDGFNGIGNFVVNTGANNTLQGAINVSVSGVPGP